MARFIRLVTALLVVVLAACSHPNPFPTDDRIPEDLNIGLERSACYGTCPVYALTVKADGAVTFVGMQFTQTMGEAKGEIDKAKVSALIQEFNKANFFALENSYTPRNGLNCSTDSPSVTTTLKINGNTKEVAHYLGCPAPRELDDLDRKIDEIVGTQRWIGGRK